MATSRPRAERPRARADGLGPRAAGRRARAPRASSGASSEALERAQAFAASLRGQARRARQRRACARRWRSSPSSTSWSAAPATTPRCASPPTPPTRRNGALLQRVQEQETAIQTTLLFFELEWAALPEERAEELLAGERLDFCRHHLRNVRRYREHLLSASRRRRSSPRSRSPARAPGRGCSRSSPRRSRSSCTATADRQTVALDVALSRLALRRPRAKAQRPPRPSPRRWRPACARAPSCSTRCSPTRRPTIACAATRTGWPRATSPTRPATSLSGADRGRARAL